MTEQLVSFETAKMAKIKGFDEPCYDAYNERGMQFSNGWLEYIDDNGTEIPFNNNQLKVNDVLLPTQSLLQKWLREVHNITLLVGKSTHPDDVDRGFKCLSFETIGSGFETKTLVATYFHKTFEEALEAGLQSALKLI